MKLRRAVKIVRLADPTRYTRTQVDAAVHSGDVPDDDALAALLADYPAAVRAAYRHDFPQHAAHVGRQEW